MSQGPDLPTRSPLKKPELRKQIGAGAWQKQAPWAWTACFREQEESFLLVVSGSPREQAVTLVPAVAASLVRWFRVCIPAPYLPRGEEQVRGPMRESLEVEFEREEGEPPNLNISSH